jgi:hypothetical protein
VRNEKSNLIKRGLKLSDKERKSTRIRYVSGWFFGFSLIILVGVIGYLYFVESISLTSPRMEKPLSKPLSEQKLLENLSVFAGSTYPGFPASYAVDGSLSTYCILDGGVPNYLGVDLGSSMFVWNVTIVSYSGYYYPVDYAIQVSLDGVSYGDVVSVVGNSNWYISHAFTPAQARYVRIYITKNAGGSSYCRIYDFKVYGSK